MQRQQHRIAIALGVLAFTGVVAGGNAASGPTDVTVDGTLTTIHSDDFEHGRSDVRYRLDTGQGSFDLELADDQPQLPRSHRVKVHGSQAGNTIAVAAGGVTAAAGGTAVAATSGAKKVAVILVNFSNASSQPYTPSYANGVVFTNAGSVAAYYNEASWGQLALSGDVFGWYTIAASNSGCDYTTWASQANQAAAAAGVTLANYAYTVYALSSAPGCGWSGLAYLPGTQSWVNGSGGMALRVVAHELGHNFGTHHASSYSCTLNGARVALAVATSCSSSEYGDPFTLMGSASTRLHTTFARGNFGWPTAANTADVTASGSYTLDPADAYDPTGVQALRIRRDSSAYLLLEYRQPYGTYFDNYTTSDPAVRGVTVRVVPGYSTLTQSRLVDATPATTSFSDASLPLGQSLNDPVGGVTITTTALAASAATVQISLGSSGSDTQPPGAPANLAATPTDSTHVALTWAASTDNVGVTGYKVYRGGSYLATAASTSYTDGGLAAGTTYSYSVTAVDAAGNQSAASNTAGATTPSLSDTTPPSAPPGLTATATDTTHIKLSWSVSTDNVGVTGYRVYRGATYLTTVASPGYTDSGLTANTTYSYTVKAVDAAGNQSAASNTASAKTADTVAPSAPSSLSASEVDVRHIALAWSGSIDNVGVTGYKLYRNGAYLKTVTTTSYTDGSNLVPNTSYSYFVTARDAAGNESARSNTATAATLDTTPPTAPVLTARVSNVTNAYLTWTASSDDVKVLGYRVYRNGVLLATISPGTRSYTDTNAPPGLDSYSVVAYDAVGNIAASNTATLAF